MVYIDRIRKDIHMKSKFEIWKELYVSFFKIGILTFGGGLAMLPMLKREVVDKHHWCDEEQMLDIYAIGQCTPGIIAVNTATYIGFQEAGILGGIIATIGEVTPSLLIIILVASVLKQYMDNAILLHAFSGIRIVVCALMLDTVVTMAKKGIKNWLGVVLFLGAILLATFTPISTVVIIIIAGFVGVIYDRLHKGHGNIGNKGGTTK